MELAVRKDPYKKLAVDAVGIAGSSCRAFNIKSMFLRFSPWNLFWTHTFVHRKILIPISLRIYEILLKEVSSSLFVWGRTNSSDNLTLLIQNQKISLIGNKASRNSLRNFSLAFLPSSPL